MSATIHSPCDIAYYYQTGKETIQCRGVTTWNLENEFTVPSTLAPSDSATVIFTCTTPKCYSYFNTIPNCPSTFNVHGQDACNIVFNAWRAGSGTSSLPIQLNYILNGNTIGSSYLSEVSTHGATQAYELANVNSACTLKYDDTQRNTFVFQNSSGSTIQLDHVKVYRTYKMCNLLADYGGSCTYGTLDGPCYHGTLTGTLGGFDATRHDTPCSCGGGGLSATHWQDDSKAGSTIEPGHTLSWTFNFGDLPDNPHRNYVGESICLFNFNNVQATSTAVGDVTLQLRLNNSPIIDTYYLSRYVNHFLAPSHDLAKEGNYHATLPNTVDLINASNVPVIMPAGGAIDIYRIYTTESVSCGPTVTVGAYDQDTASTLYAPYAWIDGNCIGQSPISDYATPGTHAIKLSPPWGCYVPSYIEVNGNSIGTGDIDAFGRWTTGNIEIWEATDVKFYFDYDTPVYNVTVRCLETVYYREGYGIQIYVDGDPWALSPNSGSLSCGTHNIGVDTPVQGLYCYGITVTNAGGQYFTTDPDIYIGSDTTIIFWYAYP